MWGRVQAYPPRDGYTCPALTRLRNAARNSRGTLAAASRLKKARSVLSRKFHLHGFQFWPDRRRTAPKGLCSSSHRSGWSSGRSIFRGYQENPHRNQHIPPPLAKRFASVHRRAPACIYRLGSSAFLGCISSPKRWVFSTIWRYRYRLPVSCWLAGTLLIGAWFTSPPYRQDPPDSTVEPCNH